MKVFLIILNILYILCYLVALLFAFKGKMPVSLWLIVSAIVVFNILQGYDLFRKTKERKIVWGMFWVISSYVALVVFWAWSYAIKHGVTPP